MAAAVLASSWTASQDEGVAAAALREAAVTVVGGLVSVEGDADLDPGLVEEVEIAGAEL
ncbi:hypothetical protein [Streptomyces xantholiticus]|uniref:BON domain-containing protein n=1 Tax=Streptomyces xantholiticus TaxID=68285 RepID=A0ABV1V4N3_9ACTN